MSFWDFLGVTNKNEKDVLFFVKVMETGRIKLFNGLLGCNYHEGLEHDDGYMQFLENELGDLDNLKNCILYKNSENNISRGFAVVASFIWLYLKNKYSIKASFSDLNKFNIEEIIEFRKAFIIISQKYCKDYKANSNTSELHYKALNFGVLEEKVIKIENSVSNWLTEIDISEAEILNFLFSGEKTSNFSLDDLEKSLNKHSIDYRLSDSEIEDLKMNILNDIRIAKSEKDSLCISEGIIYLCMFFTENKISLTK